MTQYAANVQQFAKVLKNIEGWLDKAEAHAKAKGFDPQVLLAGRLAPDQFALLRQLSMYTMLSRSRAPIDTDACASSDRASMYGRATLRTSRFDSIA